MHNYKELKIWVKGIDLAESIYKTVSEFPDSEKYGIISQLKRASISISSNIAEGASRKSQKEFSHFLSISLGSLFEIETQLVIANRIKYINDETLKELIEQINELIKMIIGFKRQLKSNIYNLISKNLFL
ncbi:MAG: four helix bundle protein [Flavobacteriales bacterium]